MLLRALYTFAVGIFLTTVHLDGLVWANERFRPNDPAQLPINSTQDRLYFVPGAQVTYVNYEAIRRDFKQTGQMSNSQIDAWILTEFAYVSEGQLKLRGLWTTDFELDLSRTQIGYRPPNYIRSAMIKAKDGGMVDVKGVGWPTGEDLEEAIQDTLKDRKALHNAQEALHSATQALQAFKSAKVRSNDSVELQHLEELELRARQKLASIQDALTHMDGSMRTGEALVETYKQESLQNIANQLNHERAPGAPRIETVETYFMIQLPWKVKDAQGEKGESVSLYGRQATFGHGRGSPVSAEIAYNPYPGVSTELLEPHGGSNALQISNSGAIFDYGSVVVTDPRARALHGYHKYSDLAVRHGAYFDLFDSDINHFSYELARSLEEKQDSWESKREWVLKQRRDFVPQIGSVEAPPTGDYAVLADLYQSATHRRFSSQNVQTLLEMIEKNNAKSLGKSSFLDTVEMKQARLEYLTLLSILSALDSHAARSLVDLSHLSQEQGKLATLNRFLGRTPGVTSIHTEGMGDVPVPPTFELWSAMRSNGNPAEKKFAIAKQLENLERSLSVGEGDPTLKKQFLADLSSSDSELRQRMADFVTRPRDDDFAQFSIEKLLRLPEVSAALAHNRGRVVQCIEGSIDRSLNLQLGSTPK